MPLLETNARRRKAHTKSRQGCGNCKLRRVKCDETKPKCKKCVTFGVDCDYESKDSNLQFAGVGAFQVEIPQVEIPDPIDRIIDGMMNAPLALHVDEGSHGPSVCYIDKPHLDLLRKFQRRTVLTIGTRESSPVYRDEMIKMASKHSFILHAILRITLMHDRYLYDPIGTKPSTAETFHSYHGVALFSKKLSAPLLESEKDAMWGTAAIFGACSLASIEATSFEDAWPLKDSEFESLDWLKMSEGKKEVWKLADPLREGSVWRAALCFEQNKKQPRDLPPVNPDLDRLFPYVIQIYNLQSPSPEGDKDPYRTAASIIERLVPIECNYSTVMWFLSFLGHMEPEFRRLIETKDPSALVLLSWWYAKLIPYGRWWVSRRALFECQAICIYLDKVLPPQIDLRRLMDFPRKVCGLQPANFVETTATTDTTIDTTTTTMRTTPEKQLLTPSASSEDSWYWKQNS